MIIDSTQALMTPEDLVQHAIDRANKVMHEGTCENSRIAMRSDLGYIAAWYEANGLPLDCVLKEHLIIFITQHIEGLPPQVDDLLVGSGIKAKRGTHKLSTIERRLASLSHALKSKGLHSPCYDPDIVKLLSKYKNIYGGSKSKGGAMTLEVLNRLLETCDNSKMHGIRDAAVLLFGFGTGGRRQSEIVSAMYDQLERKPQGYEWRMGKSKNNQSGELDIKPIAGRAAMALSHWIESSGINDGHLFRQIRKNGIVLPHGLCTQYVGRMIERRCNLAGVAEKYTAHSLRSGFVTEAGRRGKPMGDVMDMTGHRSIKQVLHYYKPGKTFQNSAAFLAG